MPELAISLRGDTMSVFFTKRGKAASSVNYTKYIDSSGTQYIDTGIIGKAGISVSCEFEVLSDSLSNFVLIGSATNNWAVRCYPVAGKDNVWKYGYINWYTSSVSTARNKKYSVSTDLSKGAQSLTVDSQQILTSQNANDMNTGLSMFIFCVNYKGSADTLLSFRLYHLSIYENGTLVRDFRPCYDPDGVACLYDKVEKKYYYNKGSGEFIAG